MPEEWKPVPVPIFNQRYEVSNKGRIRSVKKKIRYSNGIICNYKRKLRKISSYNGYNNVTLFFNGKHKSFRVCRLVALAFIQNHRNVSQVNHKNGIKKDDRVENLEWVTRSENMLHAYKTGLQKRKLGKNTPWAKLTEKDILKIRKLYFAENVKQKTISNIFKINQSTVSRIVNLKRWEHV